MTHVTTIRFQAKPGKRDAVVEHFDRWQRELRAGATGFQSSTLVSNNESPDQITVIVRFDSTANYQKNSDRAEVSAWYQGLRADLVADPQWFNGTIIRESAP